MSEEQKSMWKASFQGWPLRLIWFVLLTIIIALGLYIFDHDTGPHLSLLQICSSAMLSAVVVLLIAAFMHWILNWNHFKKFLFGAACFITLLALIRAEEGWRGKHSWDKFKHQQEALGVRFDLGSVAPATVPDEQNFAMTPIVASAYAQILDGNGRKLSVYNTNVVNRMEMSIEGKKNLPSDFGSWEKSEMAHLEEIQMYYRELAAKTNLFAVPSQPGLPAQDVLLALSKYDAAVEELRQASRLSASRFPLDYQAPNPCIILLPHLANCKSSVRLLRLRTLAELQNGMPDKALDDVLLAMRIGDSIRSEPFLISQLVRIAIFNVAFQPVYEGLAKHSWSDAQLQTLSTQLSKYDFLADYRTGMQGELAFGNGALEYLRQTRDFGELETGDVSKTSGGKFFSRVVMPDGYFYHSELAIAQMELKWLLPAVDTQRHLASPTLVDMNGLSKELEKSSPYNILARMLVPAANSVKKFAIAECSANLASVAVALERYRLVHGQYPEALDALAPQFMAAVPHDIINGQPLHYRREADGLFTLYSVGWNQKNDDGKVMLRDNKSKTVNKDEGDWIWRYAAAN